MAKQPAVREVVVVVGKPDKVRGEVPKAFIILNEGINHQVSLLKKLKM